MLKSSLLALTDQGKPAQGAIKELGLQVYDAQGKFVGLHQLFGQLGQASKTMTPEMYQAATATLFGSDAMRLAGVAAKDGSQGYDSMRVAIDRQGAAADVAAAKTKGLPGAWERVKNALESAQLDAYGIIEGPLTTAADAGSAAIGKIPDAFRQISQNPAIQALKGDTLSAFKSLVSVAKELAPSLLNIIKSLGTAAGTVGVAVWKAFVTALQAAAGVLEIISPLVKTVGDVMKANQGIVTAAAAAWALFKVVPGLLGRVADATKPVISAAQTLGEKTKSAGSAVGNFSDAYRTHMQYLRQADSSISTASQHIRTLGSVAGAAGSGGLSALGRGASGLMGALGGPWGVAITGASIALGALAKSHADAAEKARLQIEQEHALQQTLDTSTGVITQATREEVAKRFTTADKGGPTDVQRARSYGLDPNLLVDAATNTGDKTASDRLNQTAIQRGINPGLQAIKTVGEGGVQVTGDSILKDYQKIGISSNDLQQALLRQGTAWDDVSAKIKAADPGQTGMYLGLQALVDLMPDANESIVTLAQNVNEQRRQIDGGANSQRDYNTALNGTWKATQEGVDRFRDLGSAIVAVPDNKTVVLDAATTDAEQKLTALGYHVERLPNGQVKVVADTDDAKNRLAALVQQVNQPVDMPIQLRILNRDALNLPTRTADAPVIVPGGAGPRSAYASGGAIVGAGTGTSDSILALLSNGEHVWTADEVKKAGGQSGMYALRSMIRRFANGGAVTLDAVKQYASQISGGSYVRGGPAGLTATDCSGAQAAMADFITGGSGRFSTRDESQALLSRGFQQGDPPAGVAAYWIGWKNGGEGGGHTAGTILDPDGGNVNVEMGGAAGGGQYGGSAAGASGFPNRAWIQIAGGEDPNASSNFTGGSSAAVQSASASVTQSKASVTSAQAGLDQANAAVDEAKSTGKSADKVAIAEKKRDAAQQKLDAAMQRQTAAETKLTEVKDKAANGADKGKGGFDGNSLGQIFGSGLKESLSVPGFDNLLDSPNAKSLQAFANWGLGLLGGGGDSAGGGIGGDLLSGALGGAGINLPNLSNLLNPGGPDALNPTTPLPDGQHFGTGAAPGPGGQTINYNMSTQDTKTGFQQAAHHANEAYRKSGLQAVRPL